MVVIFLSLIVLCLNIFNHVFDVSIFEGNLAFSLASVGHDNYAMSDLAESARELALKRLQACLTELNNCHEEAQKLKIVSANCNERHRSAMKEFETQMKVVQLMKDDYDKYCRRGFLKDPVLTSEECEQLLENIKAAEEKAEKLKNKADKIKEKCSRYKFALRDTQVKCRKLDTICSGIEHTLKDRRYKNSLKVIQNRDSESKSRLPDSSESLRSQLEQAQKELDQCLESLALLLTRHSQLSERSELLKSRLSTPTTVQETSKTEKSLKSKLLSFFALDDTSTDEEEPKKSSFQENLKRSDKISVQFKVITDELHLQDLKCRSLETKVQNLMDKIDELSKTPEPQPRRRNPCLRFITTIYDRFTRRRGNRR